MQSFVGIDAALSRAAEAREVPGVVALAATDAGVVYEGAFGLRDIVDGPAMTRDSVFRIASMTKAITSTAAMQLMEQGRFGLDDPVEKFFPEFAKLQVFESFDPASGAYKLKPATTPVTVPPAASVIRRSTFAWRRSVTLGNCSAGRTQRTCASALPSVRHGKPSKRSQRTQRPPSGSLSSRSTPTGRWNG